MAKMQKNKTTLIDLLKVYAVIFLLWTLYRIFVHFPELVDEAIVKPLLWIVPVIFMGKNSLGLIVKSFKTTRSYNILFGLFIGILYFCLYTFLFSLRQGLPHLNPDHFSLFGMGIQAFIAVCTGIVEELVFRRYFLGQCISVLNDRVISNIFVSILFALIHLPIIIFSYHYGIAEAVSYLSILTLSSFIYGLVYLHKKSVIASASTHAIWNFLGTIIR